MKLRSVITALLTFWLIVAPVGMAWAASSSTPCESMGSMSHPLPQGDCCQEGMDAAACLSACMAAWPAAAVPAQPMKRLQVSETVVHSRPLRYATVVAPPDVAPPKFLVS